MLLISAYWANHINQAIALHTHEVMWSVVCAPQFETERGIGEIENSMPWAETCGDKINACIHSVIIGLVFRFGKCRWTFFFCFLYL